jgi:hypothetical protein
MYCRINYLYILILFIIHLIVLILYNFFKETQRLGLIIPEAKF